jgi:leucyl/phenylalanyl-tRNA--protein transferase
MADASGGRIAWYSPDPRAIIPLDRFSVPRSLRQLIRRGLFEIRFDTEFHAVICACARREETWISDEIVTAYSELHVLGHAHSVEAWQGSELVGGLYGVAIGGAFFGESMFSGVSGASKVALAALVNRLRERGFRLLDSQYINPHLLQFGTIEIPRGEYLELLEKSVNLPVEF